MRSILCASAALAFAALVMPVAHSQTAQSVSGRPGPSENLPADFIDSRPILAYFDDQPMPDTVRGLLEELKRPDRCGKGADVKPMDACALVFYRLDDEFTPDRLRPPFIIKAIYRVSDPENPADTVITMPDSQGLLVRYTGGGLFHPLRSIRANMCLHHDNTGQCTPTESRGILYTPYAILGKIENDREGILPAKSASKHFGVVADTPEQLDRINKEMLLLICRAAKTCQ